MELKNYQAKIVADLNQYLELYSISGKSDVAYNQFWERKAMKPPKPWNTVIKAVPMVCTKVPTAGGKTFLGVNALHSIFNSLPTSQHKVVVWLVPSSTILDQTLKNFRNTSHDYRLKLY